MQQNLSIGLAVLISATAAMQAAAAEPTAEARWNAIVACGSRGERERHACVDEVLREAGVLTGPSRPVATAKTAPDPAVGKSKLAAVAEGRNAFLTLTTEDGTVWRQTEARPPAPTPRAGQTFTVRKGLTGSYLCQVGSAAVFRCAPDR